MNMARFAYGADYDYTRVKGQEVSTEAVDIHWH